MPGPDTRPKATYQVLAAEQRIQVHRRSRHSHGLRDSGDAVMEKAQQILGEHAADGEPVAQGVFELEDVTLEEAQDRVVPGLVPRVTLDEPPAQAGLHVSRR